MSAKIMSIRTLFVSKTKRFETSLRPMSLVEKLAQVVCCSRFPTRLDNKQFSSHYTSCLYLGTRRSREIKYLGKPIMYRGITSTQWLTATGIMLLSGDEVSTSLSVEDLKEKGDLLCRIVGQLKEDHGIDVCVVETEEERRKYADYIVVVSGASTRHLKAMTNHLYEKSKKEFNGQIASVSGMESDDWMIVDLGSIVVHLFIPEVRAKYELEKLWSLGPDQDEQYKAMLEDDKFSEIVKQAKLEDFFVKEKKDEPVP